MLRVDKNVWQALAARAPFSVLAPMDDVTDAAFREVVARVAPPDLFFTEFTNVDALFSRGRAATLPRLRFTPRQRLVVAQIWGLQPDNFERAARLVRELGFDGVDINMGCPDKNVIKSGTCSALIQDEGRAAEIIAATRAGAGSLPVSVKTRLGFERLETERWVGFLLQQKLAAIILHARTVREMSRVPAHWGEIARAVALRDAAGVETVIVGNGDVLSLAEARQRHEETGAEGIMIGRGIFHDPWVFAPERAPAEPSLPARLDMFVEHVRLWRYFWGASKPIHPLKKFVKMYVSDAVGAARIRAQLVEADSLVELKAALHRVQEEVER